MGGIYSSFKGFKPMRNEIPHLGATLLRIEVYLVCLTLSGYLSESSICKGVLVSSGSGCLALQVTIL